MFKKFVDWLGPHLDIFKIKDASDVGAGLTRHEWYGEKTALQVGTTVNATIMNEIQKGLIPTVRAERTAGSNKDVYTVTVPGLEEFGIFEGLKMFLEIDSQNQFDNAVIKIGSTEYPLYRIKDGNNQEVGKESLKNNSHYLVVFGSGSFKMFQETNFGTVDNSVLEGKRLAEIIGLEYGGKIQDVGQKIKGKIYYDTVNKYYYECLENNSLVYNEATKFRAISNKPISDKLENLLEVRQEISASNPNLGTVKFFRLGKRVTFFVYFQNLSGFLMTDGTKIADFQSNFFPDVFFRETEHAIMNRNNAGTENARLVIRSDGIYIYGVNGKTHYELKGTLHYIAQ